MKKVICTATAGILALSLCAGCTTDSAEDGLTPVRLNEVVHSVFYAPQYVALEKGFFAEEGLEVSVFTSIMKEKRIIRKHFYN